MELRRMLGVLAERLLGSITEQDVLLFEDLLKEHKEDVEDVVKEYLLDHPVLSKDHDAYVDRNMSGAMEWLCTNPDCNTAFVTEDSVTVTPGCLDYEFEAICPKCGGVGSDGMLYDPERAGIAGRSLDAETAWKAFVQTEKETSQLRKPYYVENKWHKGYVPSAEEVMRRLALCAKYHTVRAKTQNGNPYRKCMWLSWNKCAPRDFGIDPRPYNIFSKPGMAMKRIRDAIASGDDVQSYHIHSFKVGLREFEWVQVCVGAEVLDDEDFMKMKETVEYGLGKDYIMKKCGMPFPDALHFIVTGAIKKVKLNVDLESVTPRSLRRAVAELSPRKVTPQNMSFTMVIFASGTSFSREEVDAFASAWRGAKCV